jgi:Jacalin-like lectin domain
VAYRRSNQYGGGGGDAFSDDLTETQVLVSIKVRHRKYVDQLSFQSNLGNVYGPFGGNGGTPFEIGVSQVGGFFGRSGKYLDAVGVFFPA